MVVNETAGERTHSDVRNHVERKELHPLLKVYDLSTLYKVIELAYENLTTFTSVAFDPEKACHGVEGGKLASKLTVQFGVPFGEHIMLPCVGTSRR